MREIVTARDRGRCVRCGGTATNIHHRRNRGMGGRRSAAASAAVNTPAGLLLLCGSGTTGCHGWITEHPAYALEYGYQVPTNSCLDPADVPVYVADGWWLYDDDGGRRPCPAPEGTDHD